MYIIRFHGFDVILLFENEYDYPNLENALGGAERQVRFFIDFKINRMKKSPIVIE